MTTTLQSLELMQESIASPSSKAPPQTQIEKATQWLLGMVPEVTNLIGELKDYTLRQNPDAPNLHGSGFGFDVYTDNSQTVVESTVMWQPPVVKGGPVVMEERVPSLVPPKHRLIIPNVTKETLAALGYGMPFELTTASFTTITPPSIYPPLIQLVGPKEGNDCVSVSPFRATRELAGHDLITYTSAVRKYAGRFAMIGLRYDMPSAKTLADRLKV